MSVPSLDDAKEAKEEARSGNLRENDAGISDENQIDYSEHDTVDVKGHPEAMVVFDHIARISIQTYGKEADDGLLSMEQNLEGAGPFGFSVELTLANPTLAEGQLWKEDVDEYPEYKVIGDPTSDDNDYELREEIVKDDDGTPVMEDGEPVVNTLGIGSLGPNSWDGQPVEDGEFPVDYIQVTIPTSKALAVLGALDTAGMWFHGQDGSVREGLFETPPNFGTDQYDREEDGFPRLVGYPELRADMDGQRGAIAWTFGEEYNGNRATDIDVFKLVDERLEALTSLTPEDDAYNLPTYPRVNGLYWDHHDSEAADVGADAEPRSEPGAVENAQSMMDDDGEVTYEDLTDDEKSFVDSAVEVLDSVELETIWELDTPDSETEYESLGERVDSVRATENITVDDDTLGRIVDSRIDA
jgi:hypothetical protein